MKDNNSNGKNNGEKRRKTFVLDTNVLIHDPGSLYEFEDNRIVLPMKVIEELDKFKSYKDEKGRNVREVIRQIDKLRKLGTFDRGTRLPKDGILQIISNYLPENTPDFHLGYDDVPESDFIDTGIADNEIILTALKLRNKRKEPVIFVSKDLNSRIKASALGIETQDYEKMKVVVEDLHKGYVKSTVPAEIINKLYNKEDVHISDIEDLSEKEMLPNTFIILEDHINTSHRGRGRYVKDKDIITPIYDVNKVWGIEPRSIEQRFAFDILLNDDIKLVTLVGQAGTGKTLLTIAAALQKTTNERVYDKIVVSRPIVPMGKDIGYLPGNKDEKIHLWMQPIFDNLKFIFREKNKGKETGKEKDRGKDGSLEDPETEINYLIDKGTIELEALTYIRGRSLPNQFLIIDEAQNLTPHEVKTIISRAGEGTKVVLTGDPYQIDNPYLDADSNGLIYAIDKFKNESIHGHITLSRSERSTLASLAAKLL